VDNQDTSEQAVETKTAMSRFIAVLAVLLTVVAIAWAADLFRMAGLLLYTEQFLGGIIAIALPLVFLSVRHSKKVDKHLIPWFDYLLAAIGFAGAMYMAVRYPQLAELVSDAPTDGLISGTIVVALMIEGVR